MTAGPSPLFVIPNTGALAASCSGARGAASALPWLGGGRCRAGGLQERDQLQTEARRSLALALVEFRRRWPDRRVAGQQLDGAVHHLQAAIGELHAKASAMVRVGQALDQPAPLQPVDLLGHRARGHEERLEEVGGTHGIGRPAAAQREQHAHVPGAHAEARLAQAFVLAFDEAPQATQVNGQQEITEVEVRSLALPLPRDLFDESVRFACHHARYSVAGFIASPCSPVCLPSVEDECHHATMAWQLRYASHLGYRSAQEPLFRASVGTLDPLAHVDYAASLRLAGVQGALGAAMARRGMETGCVIYTSFDNIRRPLWADAGSSAREALAQELTLAFETARRVGSSHIAVLSGIDPRGNARAQRAAFVDNLRWAAERAEKAGVVLLLESVDRARLPDMLLHHIADASEIAAAVDSPAVQLIFDTGHVQAMDGDVVRQLEAAWDHVAIVQLADTPGRLEPGSGEIDFAAVLGVLKRRRFHGLVELEFGWSVPGIETEQAFIERLRRLDATA